MTLRALLLAWSRRPFAYGADCCQFAGSIAKHFKGRNPMRDFEYGTRAQAEAIIEKYGSLEDAVTATLGDPILQINAIDGDVAMIKDAAGQSTIGSIINGRIVYRVVKGLSDMPIDYARKIWRT